MNVDGLQKTRLNPEIKTTLPARVSDNETALPPQPHIGAKLLISHPSSLSVSGGQCLTRLGAIVALNRFIPLVADI